MALMSDACAPKTSPPTQTFPYYDLLPAELREIVLHTLLVANGPTRIRLVMTKDASVQDYANNRVIITGRDPLDQQPQIYPAILRASRQIYNEGLPILYRKNTFSFTSITSLRQFTREAKAGIELLRHAEIATTGRFAFWEPMSHLVRAENLRSLSISLGPDDVRESGWSDVVLEVTDFIVRRAKPADRKHELSKISFVSSGSWTSSGSPAFRSCSSEEAPEQVRSRIEKRLALMGSMSK